MNSFSIQQYQYEYEHQSVMDSYKQWLSRDLYANLFTDKVDDPVFLQKLSFFQAEGIRHDIACHAAATHASIQNAGKHVGQKIQSAATLISSSLEDGFSLMNSRMVEVNNNLSVIGHGVNAINQTMQHGNRILSNIDKGIEQTNRGIRAMTAGMQVLSSNIAQAASVIRFSLQQMHGTIKLILDELKIPESQRERRYHIEEGMKYFSKGMKSGDCLYFEDALDEFSKATSIERKDFFSWYYIGMIHLYSKEHLDIDKALLAFDKYLHYADALVERHDLFDEALMMKAECCYLKQDPDYAYKMIEELIPVNDKAALRAMKYLSVSESTKKQAVEILKQLMRKNPYIVMQVLEDYDILSNDNITSFLEEYKENTKKEIADQLAIIEREMLSLKKYPLSYYEDTSKEFENLKSQVSRKIGNIGVVDAIALKEKMAGMLGKIKEALKEAQEKFKYSLANFIDRGDYIELKVPIGNIRMIEKVCYSSWRNESEARLYAKDLRIGGFTGWRVPTLEELLEIYTIKDICGINKNDSCFWTSSISPLVVNFSDGKVKNNPHTYNAVRCVLGSIDPEEERRLAEERKAEEERKANFIDRGDYIELKVPIGNIRMIEKVCSPNLHSWGSAVLYAKNLRKGEFTDWRVPTKEELVEIYKIKYSCGINKNKNDHDCYWSSSTRDNVAGIVSFETGYVSYADIYYCSFYVRCVRGRDPEEERKLAEERHRQEEERRLAEENRQSKERQRKKKIIMIIGTVIICILCIPWFVFAILRLLSR